MDLETVKFGFSVLQWVCMFGLALYTFMSNRSAARAKEVDDVSDRVLVLEEHIRHLPSKDLVQKLDGDMKAIRSELQGLRGEISPLVKSVDRINDYLMNNK